MTKNSTLENVLSLNQLNQKKSGHIPGNLSVTMLIRYSLALEVVKTKDTGTHYLIMN